LTQATREIIHGAFTIISNFYFYFYLSSNEDGITDKKSNLRHASPSRDRIYVSRRVDRASNYILSPLFMTSQFPFMLAEGWMPSQRCGNTGVRRPLSSHYFGISLASMTGKARAWVHNINNTKKKGKIGCLGLRSLGSTHRGDDPATCHPSLLSSSRKTRRLATLIYLFISPISIINPLGGSGSFRSFNPLRTILTDLGTIGTLA
jgi:hypothetical protein